jgi:hypothetical protein
MLGLTYHTHSNLLEYIVLKMWAIRKIYTATFLTQVYFENLYNKEDPDECQSKQICDLNPYEAFNRHSYSSTNNSHIFIENKA